MQVLAPKDGAPYWERIDADPAFREWVARNVTPHRQEDYASVTISLKAHGQAPGDATASQMRTMADLADQFGFSELRVSHQQNIVIPHVALADLPAVFEGLKQQGLATPNIGLISDLIACPGMDYCARPQRGLFPSGKPLRCATSRWSSCWGP